MAEYRSLLDGGAEYLIEMSVVNIFSVQLYLLIDRDVSDELEHECEEERMARVGAEGEVAGSPVARQDFRTGEREPVAKPTAQEQRTMIL